MAKIKKLKTKPELLKAFKKSNKNRRLVLAQKAGFNTPNEYRKFLEDQILKDIQSNSVEEISDEVPTIHNVHILDCSGSMTWGGSPNKYENAVLGINTEVKALQEDSSVNYLQTMITFSNIHLYEMHLNKTPIKKVKDFYKVVKHGGTALYDTIIKALEYLIKNKGTEKTLVKIFTDGEDRHSMRSIESARLAIERAKDADIVVTFVGTEEDVKFIVSNLSVDDSNTLIHDNTPQAVMDSFVATASATRSYSRSVLKGEDSLVGFYKQSGEL